MAEDALKASRLMLEIELDALIADVLSSSTSSTSRKRSSPDSESSTEDTALKHRKLHSASESSETAVGDTAATQPDHMHMHPSRLFMLSNGNDFGPTATDAAGQNNEEHGRPYGNDHETNLQSANSATGPSRDPVPTGPRHTLESAVRRQWDPSKDHLDYEVLLSRRRGEELVNVDRYVPGDGAFAPASDPPSPFLVHRIESKKTSTTCHLLRLPEDVQRKIFGLVLVSKDPIVFDITWLRPFLKGHARVPATSHRIEHDGSTYSVPVLWKCLLPAVKKLQHDMEQFRPALEFKSIAAKSKRSPARGLSTGLFRVSRSVSGLALGVFYSQNQFSFPDGATAWMQLESFLPTIGSTNVQHLSHVSVHVPLWHRGIQEDYVEGAIVDSFSVATRLGVIQPPAHDRLLTAIESVCGVLKSLDMKSLSFTLENGLQAEYWCGQHVNEKRLISVMDAQEHVSRETTGVEALRSLSEILAAQGCLSRLVITGTFKRRDHREEFEARLPAVVATAWKYGWVVNHPLAKRQAAV